MRSEAEEIKKRVRQREEMFLRRLFGMLAKMAKADGKVDGCEVRAAQKAFEKYPRAVARRKFCTRIFNRTRDSYITIEAMAEEFAHKWALPSDCLAAYELLWDIACADGVLKRIHKVILKRICPFLGLPATYFDLFLRKRAADIREEPTPEEKARENAKRAEERRRARSEEAFRGTGFEEWFGWGSRSESRPPLPMTPLRQAFALIGVEETASNEELRHAYRTLAIKNHPDMIRAKGGSETQVEEATQYMAKINSAWELIRESRGI